jgi:hypothetical protein
METEATAADAVQRSEQEDRKRREQQEEGELRRAGRRARRLAEAQQREENARYPLCEVQVSLPRVKDPVKLNVTVMLIAIACVRSLVIWCAGTYCIFLLFVFLRLFLVLACYPFATFLTASVSLVVPAQSIRTRLCPPHCPCGLEFQPLIRGYFKAPRRFPSFFSCTSPFDTDTCIWPQTQRCGPRSRTSRTLPPC